MAVRDQDTAYPPRLSSTVYSGSTCSRRNSSRWGGQDRQQRPPLNNRIAIEEIKIIVGGPLLSDKVFLAVDEIPTLKKAHIDHTITFDDSDLEGVKTPHQDPLVINAGIGDPCYNVKRILVDNVSSVDILFYSTFLNLGLAREKLQPTTGPLYGFDNRPVRVEGIISLPVVLGEFPWQSTHSIQFVIVKSKSAYNAIFRRPYQPIFGIVTSIPHLKLKFYTPTGVIVVCGDQQTGQTGYLRQVKIHPTDTLNIEDFDLQNEDIPQRASPIEELTTVNPANKPVIQKKRNFAPDCQQTIEQEVDKLLKAVFIREVHYPTWMANVVLMNLTDEEATAFQIDRGLYCYWVMPFGLKNAGETYQRLMNNVFKTLIGHNMEVYVDDMLVKSLEKSQHISNLEKCFRLSRRYNMSLNPAKCAFGVASEKFLGFMVTHKGIEANPKKIKALRDMVPPKNIKEVQRLNGRIAALSRFLAHLGDKYLTFFKILRGALNSGFQQTDECQEAFEHL
ncbi:uncharacterized protein LOC110101896 [Dendrobium catenatum]|uniref:uncharacterized protein LOC110101896 n=1 Tax=Dendrobium catenatum TaxID=906689 RepID=UPI0009F73C2A|nr:uncharacterized protein LOC110101896 [Dendrobium catenatum]